MSELKYYWGCVCWWLHRKIGTVKPTPYNNMCCLRMPRVQYWLARQIPDDSW